MRCRQLPSHGLRTNAPVFAISAATGEGCRELSIEVARFLQRSARRPTAADDEGSMPSPHRGRARDLA